MTASVPAALLVGVAMATLAILSNASATPQLAKTPDECRSLGFITEELFCNSCEILHASYAGAAKAAASSNPDEEEEGDGDTDVSDGGSAAEKAPSPADLIYHDCMSCCTPVAVGIAARSGKSRGKKHPAPVLYEAAKIEINYRAFQESAEWQTFAQVDVPKMFPEGGAVIVAPGHSYQNFIHLYKPGLDPAVDAPSFSLDVQSWDQSKILEFLNHSIASSPLIREEMEKSERG